MEAQDRGKAKKSNTRAKNWKWAYSAAETEFQTSLGKYSQNYHHQLLQKDTKKLIYSHLACSSWSLSKSGCTVLPPPTIQTSSYIYFKTSEK